MMGKTKFLEGTKTKLQRMGEKEEIRQKKLKERMFIGKQKAEKKALERSYRKQMRATRHEEAGTIQLMKGSKRTRKGGKPVWEKHPIKKFPFKEFRYLDYRTAQTIRDIKRLKREAREPKEQKHIESRIDEQINKPMDTERRELKQLEGQSHLNTPPTNTVTPSTPKTPEPKKEREYRPELQNV
jgi:hypothetical protein